MMRHAMTVMAVVGLLVLGTTRADAELVTNGGFETGNLSSWSGFFNGVVSNPTNVYDGSFAGVSSFGSHGLFSQQLSTVAGGSYTLDFFYATRSSQGDTTSFTVNFGGSTVFSDTNDWNNGTLKNGYKEVTMTVAATNATTLLSFNMYAANSFWLLDDVSVTPLASVPEPSSLAMGSMAILAGLGCWARRRRMARD